MGSKVDNVSLIQLPPGPLEHWVTPLDPLAVMISWLPESTPQIATWRHVYEHCGPPGLGDVFYGLIAPNMRKTYSRATSVFFRSSPGASHTFISWGTCGLSLEVYEFPFPTCGNITITMYTGECLSFYPKHIALKGAAFSVRNWMSTGVAIR